MGQIDYYSKLYEHKPGIKNIRVVQPISDNVEKQAVAPFLKVHDITLAQYDDSTKNLITAHRLKDYRRKQFNFVLLPVTTVLFDRLLEGSMYWDELLKNESAYA